MLVELNYSRPHPQAIFHVSPNDPTRKQFSVHPANIAGLSVCELNRSVLLRTLLGAVNADPLARCQPFSNPGRTRADRAYCLRTDSNLPRRKAAWPIGHRGPPAKAILRPL